MNSPTLKGIAAILFWSSTVAFSRAISEGLGPLATGAAIYTLGGMMGLIAACRTPGGIGRMLRMPRRCLVGCGALFVLYLILLYIAIGIAQNRTQVLAVGLANYLWVPLIMLFSIPLLGNQPRIWLLPGTCLALAGIYLATTSVEQVPLASLLASAESPLPVVLALAAAVVWALYSNLTYKWAQDGGSAVPLFLLASGLVFWGMHWSAGEVSQWAWTYLPTLLFMALFPAWLGYQFWDDAMQRGNRTLVTAVSYFTPLLSTLISLLVLRIQPGVELGLAALLVTLGALFSKWGIRDSSPKNGSE